MGLRFSEDQMAPGERFKTLKERLGDAFEVIEIDSSPGNADGFGQMAHSVLTDEVREVDGQPAYEARKRVVEFLTQQAHIGSRGESPRRMAIDNLVVETTHGPVRGVDDGRVRVWKGIRYAAPPVGDLRFRAPQPPERWTEVADATRYGPACPQPVFPNMPLDLGAPQGEDCLTAQRLGVVGTGAGDGKPVMVWLHGGAYVLGSGSQALYDGRRLAGGGDVIVVTVNYRLGALGFLDLSSFSTSRRRFDSNVGLRDVLAALRWVRDNIAAFGGDPEHGSRCSANPPARGSSRRCSPARRPRDCSPARSPRAHRPRRCTTGARAQRVAETVLDRLDVDADRLPDVPTAVLLAASQEVFDEVPVRNPGTLAFVPIVDGELLHDYPVKLAQEGRSHPGPVDHRHQQARGGAVPVDAVTADADHPARDHVDVRRDRRRATRPAVAHRGADRVGVLAVAAQGKELEHRHRRRLPDALGVARRGPQQGGAGVPVPVRLCDAAAEAAVGQTPPMPPNCLTSGAIWAARRTRR